MNILYKLWSLLTGRERKTFIRLLILITFTSIMNVVAISSIMPFMALLGDSSILDSNKYFNEIFIIMGKPNVDTFIMTIGISVIVLFILSSLLTIFVTRRNVKYIHNVSYNISKKLFSNYMNREYKFFLNRNSSELSKNLFNEVYTVITSIALPIMDGVSQAFIGLFIIILLISVNPSIALIVGVVIGGLYLLVMRLLKNKMLKLSKVRVENNQKRFKIANEAFGGIKVLKLLHKENVYCNLFNEVSNIYEVTGAKASVAMRLPKPILEMIAFGGIIIISFILFLRGNSSSNLLSTLSVFALSAYKLQPALHAIFVAINSSRANSKSIDVIYDDLKADVENNIKASKESLKFKDILKLENITFSYNIDDKPVIKNLSLDIKSKSSVAFIGATGSGKTTVIDIILGLLQPDSGEISIDTNILCEEKLVSWQNNIGYVPQQVYLTDDTITKNIAFGLSDDEVDIDRVIQVSKIANIFSHIDSLPMKFNTNVGERGVKLSGGQIQRIGIARALYNDPDVLVLDEATSALDNETEEQIISSIDKLNGSITIIMIAHRLSTVKRCDKIFLLENGQIKDSGNFDYLVREKHIKLENV